MSKGYSEALALIEAGKQIALGTVKEKPMPRDKDKNDTKVDLMALLEQKRREYLAVKNFVDEQHKLNKPEEKKDKGWSTDHIAMFLMGMLPVNWAVLYLLLK